MGRLLTLFSQGTILGGGTPATFISSGNRNRSLAFKNLTSNANPVRQSRLFRKTPLLYGGSNPRLTYGNWFTSAAGGESTADLLTMIVKSSIEIPGDAIYRVTFGGSDSVTLNPGDTVESDPVAITIPADTDFYVRTYRYFQGTSGSTFYEVQCVYVAQGTNAYQPVNKGEGLISGTDPLDDRTLSGTITAIGAVTQAYGPMLIRMEPTEAGANVLIIGDSIPTGSGDGSGGTARGDFLNGTSPTAPYINIGDVGWVERAIAGRNALFNISVPGRTAAGFTRANAPKLFEMVDRCPPTHLVLTTGVNDLLASTSPITADQLVTRNQNIMDAARSDWGTLKCYPTTITPVTAGSWGSIGTQTLTGTVAGISSPYWANFTDNTQTSGRSRYNELVRTNVVSADGHIDASLPLEDPTDERYWNSASGARTSDGIHPNQAGHTDAKASLDPVALFG